MAAVKQKLVVIGNGMAPGRALEHLLELAPDAYEIVIFDAEPRVNFQTAACFLQSCRVKRILKKCVISHGDGWYIKHGITLYKRATKGTEY